MNDEPTASLPRRKAVLRLDLSPGLYEAIRVTGRGYNSRVENVLREALAKGLLDQPAGDLVTPATPGPMQRP